LAAESYNSTLGQSENEYWNHYFLILALTSAPACKRILQTSRLLLQAAIMSGVIWLHRERQGLQFAK
jgi:hypothetical protein